MKKILWVVIFSAGLASAQTKVFNANPPNSVRLANSFNGADWCAKERAADADLGLTAGEIWVDQSAGKTECAAAPKIATGHTLRFIQAGTYSISVGWTQANINNFGIIGTPGTVISFTGIAGMTISGSTGLGAYGLYIDGITFSGNSGTVNVITLVRIFRSHLYFAARNSSGFAINLQGSLLNDMNFIVSGNQGAFSASGGGVIFDSSAAPVINSNNNRVYAVMEGTAGPGVELKNASGNVLTGTSEGNNGPSGWGIILDDGALANTVTMDFESNSAGDISSRGGRNVFLNEIAGTVASGQPNVHCFGGGYNLFIGGLYGSITVDFGSAYNSFETLDYNAGGSQVFTVSDPRTWKTKVHNGNLSTYDTDVWAANAAQLLATLVPDTGKITSAGGGLMPGMGASIVAGSLNTGPLTAAIAPIAFPGFLPSSSTAGLYRMDVYLSSTSSCAAPGAASISFQMQWTDLTGTVQSAITPLWSGVRSAMPTTALGLGKIGVYANGFVMFQAGANTAITYQTTYLACPSGTGTYTANAILTKLR